MMYISTPEEPGRAIVSENPSVRLQGSAEDLAESRDGKSEGLRDVSKGASGGRQVVVGWLVR